MSFSPGKFSWFVSLMIFFSKVLLCSFCTSWAGFLRLLFLPIWSLFSTNPHIVRKQDSLKIEHLVFEIRDWGSLLTKQKQTHRLRERTYCCWGVLWYILVLLKASGYPKYQNGKSLSRPKGPSFCKMLPYNLDGKAEWEEVSQAILYSL